MNETRGTYICQYFKLPHLYRDDLAQIERIIREQLRPQEFHLAFDGQSYDHFADIPVEKTQARVFVFYTHNPCLRLKFARSWAELYCAETNSEIQAGLEEIKQIILKSERPVLWRFAKYANWCAPLVGFGAVAITAEAIAQDQLPRLSMAWALGVLALAALWWLAGSTLSVRRFSCMELQRDRPAS